MADELEQSLLEHLRSRVDELRADRQAARDEIQKYAGDSIHLARRSVLPATQEDKYAIMIRRIATVPNADLEGDPCYAIAVVQFTVLGNERYGAPAGLMVQKLATQLRILFSSYQGDMGENGYVYDSEMVRFAMGSPSIPIDASDGWGYSHQIDFRIFYQQQSVDYA